MILWERNNETKKNTYDHIFMAAKEICIKKIKS